MGRTRYEPGTISASLSATPVLHSSRAHDAPPHAITETPPVKEALDELRDALGGERVQFGELVILGAREKLARVRAEQAGLAGRRSRLAERVRSRALPVDPDAADRVRRSGWTRD